MIINKFFENHQCKIILSAVFCYIYKKTLMNYSKCITKEIVVSDNGALLHCLSLYILINTIIYIYIVVNAWFVPFSDTTATKISQTLVLPFPPIFISSNGKNNPPRMCIDYGLRQSCLIKYCSMYHGRPADVIFWCIIRSMLLEKITQPNWSKDRSLNTLCKWSKWEKIEI